MKIHGLQKLTLLDFPGRTACTVFLGGCDFACPFCHNAEIIDGSAEAIMDDTELLAFLEKRKGLLDGVAITGGEPTLRKDLPILLESIKSLGYKTKLDSNGNNPEMLKTLLDSKLVDYIAIDVKNSREKYALTCGKDYIDMAGIEKSIDLIKTYADDYEFRTTVIEQLHDEESFFGIGELINGAKKYFLQAFTDRDSVVFAGFSAPDKEKMLKYADIMRNYTDSVQLRGID